jgi:hypothetical protein
MGLPGSLFPKHQYRSIPKRGSVRMISSHMILYAVFSCRFISQKTMITEVMEKSKLKGTYRDAQ